MLNIANLNYRYDAELLLNHFNCSLSNHEVLCLLGESGSGKSTLLRIIAGLEKPLSGEIYWNGVKINNVPPEKRNFGLMFQDYALFPNRTVAENIAFGMEMKKGVGVREISERVTVLLDQIGMSNFRNRKVTELSGGEQQRVALARSLAPKPHLLMLDEPLGALDHALRQGLLAELREILGRNGIPAIYVTHDQEEGFSIGNRIALLKDGKILQSGSPESVYRNPESVWAARFLGHQNICPAVAISANKVECKLGTRLSRLEVQLDHDLIVRQKVHLLFRELAIQDEPTDSAYRMDGVIKNVIFKGFGYETIISVGDDAVFSVWAKRPKTIGEKVSIPFNSDQISVIFT